MRQRNKPNGYEPTAAPWHSDRQVLMAMSYTVLKAQPKTLKLTSLVPELNGYKTQLFLLPGCSTSDEPFCEENGGNRIGLWAKKHKKVFQTVRKPQQDLVLTWEQWMGPKLHETPKTEEELIWKGRRNSTLHQLYLNKWTECQQEKHSCRERVKTTSPGGLKPRLPAGQALIIHPITAFNLPSWEP